MRAFLRMTEREPNLALAAASLGRSGRAVSAAGLLAAVGLAGCAGSAGPALVPEAVSTTAVAAEATGDSAAAHLADEAGLEPRELEFRSLGKAADHVRGVVATAGAVAASSIRRSVNRPGGGVAATPTYDLNIESYATNQRVQRYLNVYRGRVRARFTRWLGRMARYEGMIRNVLRGYGLPEDLVYLALIESGYSNNAVSRARAVGMWQFIRSTGRQYGLRIDSWVDERRDPFKATDAAARHLWDLKEQFGSWYLAAAAYNGGAGRVSRGISRLPSDETSDSTFFTLADKRWLRYETREYVPKLIAATMLAKDPAAHGFDSIPALEPLVFDEITVPEQTGLDVIAELADTTVRALRELNPHFYRGVTPPSEASVVRVPRGTGNTVAQRYADVPPSERVHFVYHFVRRGETLGEIAARYRIGLSFLRAANPGLRPRKLRIGHRLLIPVSRSARQGEAKPPAQAPPPNGVHTVRWGETLWIVSQRYGVRVDDLRAWNHIGPRETLVRVGQRLRVIP